MKAIAGGEGLTPYLSTVPGTSRSVVVPRIGSYSLATRRNSSAT